MEARRRGRTRRLRLRAAPAEAGRRLQPAPLPLPLVRTDPSPQRASGCLNLSGLCSLGRSVFATNPARDWPIVGFFGSLPAGLPTSTPPPPRWSRGPARG